MNSKKNIECNCPLRGDETDNCQNCVYSGDYHFVDGECRKRTKQEILDELIKNHNEGKCNCDLRDEGTGLCTAGAYLSGCVSLEDTLNDLD